MPSPKSNTFTSYEFSSQEYTSAVILNPLQKMHIQTQCATIAESILNLTVNHKDVEDFAVQHSYLKGQLDILAYLITLSESQEINIRDNDGVDMELVNQEQQPLRNLFTQPTGE